MVELILLSLPSLVYLAVRRRHLRDARRIVGLTWPRASEFAIALGVGVALWGAGWAVYRLIPADVLNRPGVIVVQASAAGVLGACARAVGEEMLFRGFLQGLLVKRFGFALGNLAQAVLFLVPHLLLLSIDTRLWPIVPVQAISGWVLGWLRHRSDSISGPALVHALVNVSMLLR